MRRTQDYLETNSHLNSIFNTNQSVHIRVRSFFYRKIQMVFAQIERLKKDSAELDIYAKKLEKKGEVQRAQKIKKKREFIERALSEVKQNS